MPDFIEPDANGASFGEWLNFLLYVHGTRPTGSPDKPGIPWVKKDLAEQLGKSDTAVGYWLANEKLPEDMIALERQLFGTSNKYDRWRQALRAARNRGRESRRRVPERSSSPANAVADPPSRTFAAEKDDAAPPERTFGLEIKDEHLASYDEIAEIERAHEDSRRLGISVRTPAAQFLRGAESMSWAVINSVAVPRRDHEDRITRSVLENRLTIVSAAAGDGKTTLCKRVALRLKSAGWRVFYATAPDEVLPELSIYRFPSGRTAVFIDNAEYIHSFSTIGSFLNINPHVQLILIGRHHQVIGKLKPVAHLNPSEHFISLANDLVAQELAERIVQHDAASGGDVSEVLDAINRNILEKQTHFLAIMISATRGESFSKYILSMIRQFSASGDDWILRSVAIVSHISSLSKKSEFFLDSSLLAHLSIQHHVMDRPTSVKTIVERVESELLRRSHAVMPANRIALSLRHPDIEGAVLKHFYDIDASGDVGNLEDFENDLEAICVAATLRTMEKIDTDPTRKASSVAVQIIETLLTVSNSGIPKSVATEVGLKCSDLWGQSETDKAQARRFISPILRSQLAEGADAAPDVQMTGAKYLQLGGADPNLMTAWLSYEFEHENAGSPELAFSGRWLGLEYLSRTKEPDATLLACWLQKEFDVDNAGTVDKICSARWIASVYFTRATHLAPNFLLCWQTAEFNALNAGDIEKPNSARWIGREYLSRVENPDPNFLASWLKYEFEIGNAGSVDEEYSGRWLGAKMMASGKVPNSTAVSTWMKAELDFPGKDATAAVALQIARDIGKSAWALGARGEDYVRKVIHIEQQFNNLGSRSLEGSGLWYFWTYWSAGYRGVGVLSAMLFMTCFSAHDGLDEVRAVLKDYLGEPEFNSRVEKCLAAAKSEVLEPLPSSG